MLSMELPIRRFDIDLPLPEYKTERAAAMDCVTRIAASIPARSIGYIPLNIAIKPPAGHMVLMAARSSLHKRGLMMANGVGVFDEDFCGDGDEYQVILYNFSNETVEIPKGERLVQILVLPVDRVSLKEVERMEEPTRGGIGSTDV
ncbi:MAG: dUTP pyrophosphatase [Parcubacteria bacterium C7867-004]|nr:MAG: dUTP pyrophosphatase [Parcubacteria bacterium C7867-004]